VGFGPERAAALFGANDLADVRADRSAYYDRFVLPDDDAGRAARFFILHRTHAESELRGWLGDAGTDFLRAMAAIVPAEGGLRSLVSASWFAGLLIFADARAYNAVWPGDPFPDYVMPPGGDSLGLWRVAPRTPRHSTLDLCCGPGTQALAAARYSERVTGVDLNPRALRFAHVNAAANGIAHARFVLGDAYAPLGDERFDAILANPPFVPWPAGDEALLFRGGGARGEDVLARILAGAVERLAPGGSLAIVADLADVATLPGRILAWQNVNRRTLIVLQHHADLLSYAETHAAHHDDRAVRQAEVVRLLEHYRQAGIATLDFGYIVQDGEPGATQVERTSAALAGDLAPDVTAWFAHQRRLATEDIADSLVGLAPGLRLVEVAEREPPGETQVSCYVAPGAGSLHEARPVSRPAFALLIRAAAGDLRPRDVSGDDARELTALLASGIVRLP
jgi:carbamoyltransferase